MSADDWKDLYQAAVDGNLSLVDYRINEKVNPNYQHPEILRTPVLVALASRLTSNEFKTINLVFLRLF